jgi:hypothetical protein
VSCVSRLAALAFTHDEAYWLGAKIADDGRLFDSLIDRKLATKADSPCKPAVRGRTEGAGDMTTEQRAFFAAASKSRRSSLCMHWTPHRSSNTGSSHCAVFTPMSLFYVESGIIAGGCGLSEAAHSMSSCELSYQWRVESAATPDHRNRSYCRTASSRQLPLPEHAPHWHKSTPHWHYPAGSSFSSLWY